jgi:hypothetical protein
MKTYVVNTSKGFIRTIFITLAKKEVTFTANVLNAIRFDSIAEARHAANKFFARDKYCILVIMEVKGVMSYEIEERTL